MFGPDAVKLMSTSPFPSTAIDGLNSAMFGRAKQSAGKIALSDELRRSRIADVELEPVDHRRRRADRLGLADPVNVAVGVGEALDMPIAGVQRQTRCRLASAV